MLPNTSLPNFQSPEAHKLYEQIHNRNLPTELFQKLLLLIQRVDSLIEAANYREHEGITNYINWVTRIPFDKYSEEIIDLDKIKIELDSNHYGVEEVKNKILEFMSIMKLRSHESGEGGNELNRDIQTPTMLFIGIQGIGKTTMARSIATALNRGFVRISLGGMASAYEIKGMAKGFPESEPGQIIKSIIEAGHMNPVILLDEMDKVGEQDGAGQDIMSALLEVLDPEQNNKFIDRYIDHPIDLSKVLFIATANNLGGISSALLDRMEKIRFTSYSDEDKKQIARNYLLPKIRRETGLQDTQLVFDDGVWDLIVRPLGFDAGIRELERTLMNVARKVAKKIVEGEGEVFRIGKDNFREYIPDDFGVYT